MCLIVFIFRCCFECLCVRMWFVTVCAYVCVCEKCFCYYSLWNCWTRFDRVHRNNEIKHALRLTIDALILFLFRYCILVILAQLSLSLFLSFSLSLSLLFCVCCSEESWIARLHAVYMWMVNVTHPRECKRLLLWPPLWSLHHFCWSAHGFSTGEYECVVEVRVCDVLLLIWEHRANHHWLTRLFSTLKHYHQVLYLFVKVLSSKLHFVNSINCVTLLWFQGINKYFGVKIWSFNHLRI